MDEENTLFPVEESPEFIDDGDQLDRGYHYTVAWDVEKQDFVLNGKGQMELCDGVEGYKVWCCKMALTQRYTCAAYQDEIGTELDEALAEDSEKAVESAIERTISEALLVNPRTEYVRNFEFSWSGEAVSVSFTVKGVDTDEFKVSI